MTMKAVPDFPNYRLTKDGKLYSLRKKKFIKEKPGGLKKYPRWELWRDGQRFHKWCHRLVCQVWVSCCIGLQVHHKNGDVLNYHPSNLVPLNPEQHREADRKLRAKLARQQSKKLKESCPF